MPPKKITNKKNGQICPRAKKKDPIVAGSTIDPLLTADRLCFAPFFWRTIFCVAHQKSVVGKKENSDEDEEICNS
jgi:hypothetical protein